MSTQRAREVSISTDRPEPSTAVAVRRLTRPERGRLLGGVARGVAEHLRLPVWPVRLGFVLLCAFSGFGLVVYVVLWVLVRPQPTVRTSSAIVHNGRRVAALAVLAGLAGVAVLVLVSTGTVRLYSPVWPLAVVGVGAALLWRAADETYRERWRQAGGRLPGLLSVGHSRGDLVRVIGGGLLVLAGLAGFLAVSGQLSATGRGLVGTVVVLVGLAVVLGPWLWRQTSDLAAERTERIRSQERAELAAHLHDSVLQTLALIQRQAESPREVVRLARGQERALRTWLYRPDDDARSTRFAAAVRATAADVEDRYGLVVDAVVVGDAPLSPALQAMCGALGEALVNAAKHAGVDEVSVYAEVEGDSVSVFVRDRGRGFDPERVPADRQGLAGSIVGRMTRHGGTATVTSRPGAGTEVALTVSLAAVPS